MKNAKRRVHTYIPVGTWYHVTPSTAVRSKKAQRSRPQHRGSRKEEFQLINVKGGEIRGP